MQLGMRRSAGDEDQAEGEVSHRRPRTWTNGIDNCGLIENRGRLLRMVNPSFEISPRYELTAKYELSADFKSPARSHYSFANPCQRSDSPRMISSMITSTLRLAC